MESKTNFVQEVNAKTRVVSACSPTIKKQNLHDLFQIIQTDQDIAA